jgi:hypothetical protein
MQYFVTVATSEGRQVNHIKARTLIAAIRKVNEYNKRHPDWDMLMCDIAPQGDDVMMPVELVS